jgi:type II secretory pathway pseudopilin PulG
MLLEALVAIALVSLVIGFATTVMIRAHHRFGKAMSAADARAALARASRRMATDIRACGAVEAGENALVLTGPGASQVTWRVREGKLVRAAGDRETVYRADVAALRASVEERSGASPFVEVRIEPAAPDDREKGAGGIRVVCVAAGPRVRGERR